MNKKMLLDDQNAVCGRYISYLYRKSGTSFTARLKSLGLSSMQSIVLIGIYRYSGINQQNLAQSISVDPGVISRVLRELEDNGLIEKKRDDQNRRNLNLYLTESGYTLAEKSLIIQGNYWDVLLEEFTPEEMKTLNSLLKRMERKAFENNEDTNNPL